MGGLTGHAAGAHAAVAGVGVYRGCHGALLTVCRLAPPHAEMASLAEGKDVGSGGEIKAPSDTFLASGL